MRIQNIVENLKLYIFAGGHKIVVMERQRIPFPISFAASAVVAHSCVLFVVLRTAR